jgi:uncharacterized protein YjiS (DUF1127 family)
MDRTFDSFLAASAPPRRSFLARLLAHGEVRRSRRALLDLDDHLLRDVGLTRRQALTEAERPAWDAPAHWLR